VAEQQFEKYLHQKTLLNCAHTDKTLTNPKRPKTLSLADAASSKQTSFHSKSGAQYIDDEGYPMVSKKTKQPKRTKVVVVIGKRPSDSIVATWSIPPKNYVESRPARAHNFLSRIRSDKTEDDAKEWSKEVVIICEEIVKLPQRFNDQNYQSFHLSLQKDCDYADFLATDLWPTGTLVKRWFFSRNPTVALNSHRQVKPDFDITITERQQLCLSSINPEIQSTRFNFTAEDLAAKL